MTTYCDVNTCEDCPRYGDDCDGDKRVEHTDTISRADAIEAVHKKCDELGLLGRYDIQWVIEALPSADAVQEAVPTVVRVTMSDGSQYYLEHERDAIQADVVQGEWILVKGNNGKDYHKCSKCLHTQEITGVKNYCAVCGARMKGGVE